MFGILDKGRAMSQSEMDDRPGADVGVKIMGNEVNIKNFKSLNTLATVATLCAVCAIGVFTYFHEVGAQQDKATVASTLQKSNADIAGALKESTSAMVHALKESNTNTLNALRELTTEQKKSTVAIREGNCLQDPAMRNRPDARDFCKRLTRDDR